MSASEGSGSSNNGRSNSSNNILFFHPSRHTRRLAKRYRTELSAGAASLLSTFGGFPLDLVKSRMQSYNTPFIATVKDAYKAEGLRSFWRGVGPPLASILFVRTASMSIYQRAKYFNDRMIHKLTGQSPLVTANAPGAYPNIWTALCFGAAGAAAGASVTVLSCPFELTKLNEQLAGKEARNNPQSGMSGPTSGGSKKSSGMVKNYFKTGSFATAKRLVKARGWRGLYTGYSLHLMRDTIGTAVYFTTYESVKQLIGNAQGYSATSPLAVLAGGGLCGVISWVIVSCTQIDYGKLSSC